MIADVGAQDAEVAIKQDDSVKNDAEATPLRKVDDDSKEKKTAGEDTKSVPSAFCFTVDCLTHF